MTPPDTLVRMISEREQDIAALQAELDVLRGLGAPQASSKANGTEPVHEPLRPGGRRKAGMTRQQMLAQIVRDAGRAGLTRSEAIERMAAICDSPPNSVAQMLSLLARAGAIKPGPDGRWRAVRN